MYVCMYTACVYIYVYIYVYKMAYTVYAILPMMYTRFYMLSGVYHVGNFSVVY